MLRTSNCSLLLTYLHRKGERLSRPGWLTYSGRFIHISGHPSAAGRAQDSKSSPVRDRRSTTVPRNQPLLLQNVRIIMLPLHSCGGTLKSLYLKLLYNSTQTSADGLNGQRQVSRMTIE